MLKKNWSAIPEHFPNTELDDFIIMPTHIHGIIIIERKIEKESKGIANKSKGTACRAPDTVGKGVAIKSKDAACCVPTIGRKMKPGSLGVIIRSYKSSVTKEINGLSGTPGKQFWQRNYWERIIRNDKELFNIRKYIQQNPLKWALEKETIENISF